MTIDLAPLAPTARWKGAELLLGTVAANLKGEQAGIYSVCCSHPLVIEAALDQSRADDTILLVEATANQVNQFGGYTGMTPADYVAFVRDLAEKGGVPQNRIVLGGDHLGPVCWTGEPAEAAMAKAEVLVAAFASAGFQKLHLDCSMPCADDPERLDDAIVADRAARLCMAAEDAAVRAFGSSRITYVIGTEVPPPGGADESLTTIEVTPVDRATRTLETHRSRFAAAGLDEVWPRVIAMVLQPGVEFDHSAVIDYRPELAEAIKAFAETGTSGIAFEAHSTDYQRPAALARLVQDHFAIVKVGPGLTFALREALFALSHIEDELVSPDRRSRLREVCEERMLANPAHWRRFYGGGPDEERLLRRYSLSDRIRYYWPDEAIEAAVQAMFDNLADRTIPLGLLAQFMPDEIAAVREGRVPVEPAALVREHVRIALRPYVAACYPFVPA